MNVFLVVVISVAVLVMIALMFAWAIRDAEHTGKEIGERNAEAITTYINASIAKQLSQAFSELEDDGQ